MRFLGIPVEIVVSTKQFRELKSPHQNAVLITSSKKHAQQFGENSSYILESNQIPEQLHELNDRFQIFEKINFLTICSICNTPIKSIEKSEIEDQVPPKVREPHDSFWYCEKCGRVYWEGSHIKRLKNKLQRMNVPV